MHPPAWPSAGAQEELHDRVHFPASPTGMGEELGAAAVAHPGHHAPRTHDRLETPSLPRSTDQSIEPMIAGHEFTAHLGTLGIDRGARPLFAQSTRELRDLGVPVRLRLLDRVVELVPPGG